MTKSSFPHPSRRSRLAQGRDDALVQARGMERVHIVDHPAVAERLALMRDARTEAPAFRRALDELGAFLAYEAARDLQQRCGRVATPVAEAEVRTIARGAVAVPVLRAGLALVGGFVAVVPNAEIAHVGMYRDPVTLEPVPYYANLPEDLTERPAFVLDPMLATGGSAIAACRLLAERGATRITLVCAIAAPEGLAALFAAFPDARVVTAAQDVRLNEHGYIVPGLGDAGDRAFGTASSVPSAHRTATQR